MHTSTVTVALIDDNEQPNTTDESEFRIEWFSGSGAGGQHRNKTQNSCRIVHVPTGICGISQGQRTRSANEREAMRTLKARIDDERRSGCLLEINRTRKNQVGSGMRGDKIRTYRFQDDTVTDHLSGKSASAKRVMKGDFSLLWRVK